MHRHHPLRRHRRGFTLLEILIVVALIATLAAFLTMAIGRSITQAREAATRTTLLKLDGMLQQRLEAFRTLMDSPQRQNEMKGRIPLKKAELKNGTPSLLIPNEKLLLIMIYKEYYRAGFPQTLADNLALDDSRQYFAADYQLPDNSQPFKAQLQNPAESSEMLYWLLTQADTFGVPPVDDSEFTSSELADTDNDGRMEFIDAWGLPLRFYRWPTRLIRPLGPAAVGGSLTIDNRWRELAGLLIRGLPSPPTNAGDADPLTTDPDDRLGIFLATVSSKDSNPVITPTQFENLYHTPDTYHIPLILSGGPDRATGLNEPYDSGSGMGRLAGPLNITLGYVNARSYLESEMNDNLTNRQKQQK